jgi:hypothetical protein
VVGAGVRADLRTNGRNGHQTAPDEKRVRAPSPVPSYCIAMFAGPLLTCMLRFLFILFPCVCRFVAYMHGFMLVHVLVWSLACDADCFDCGESSHRYRLFLSMHRLQYLAVIAVFLHIPFRWSVFVSSNRRHTSLTCFLTPSLPVPGSFAVICSHLQSFAVISITVWSGPLLCEHCDHNQPLHALIFSVTASAPWRKNHLLVPERVNHIPILGG